MRNHQAIRSVWAFPKQAHHRAMQLFPCRQNCIENQQDPFIELPHTSNARCAVECCYGSSVLPEGANLQAAVPEIASR